jgi:hypothetical protein
MSLQDVIDSSITGTGANRVGDRIELGKETIDLHETLDVASSEGAAAGVRLAGRGRATRFRWLGPESGPVFRFSDANGCELSAVTIEFVSPAAVVVQMLDSGSGAVRSSHNTLRDIHVSDASGKIGTFWWIGGGADQKNDFMRGYDLDVSGCEIGVQVEGRNALNHELYGCLFKGRTAGKTGIRTANGGSIRIFGGGLVQFTESVFDVDTRNGVALIASGVHIEKCARLLVAPEPEPPAVTTHVTIIDGVRWGSDVAEIPESGEIIDYSGGTLIVRGCWFGTGTPRETSYRFRYTTTQAAGDFIFEDCRVRAANPTGHWPGLPPTSVRGTLLYLGASRQPQPIPAA